MDSLKLIAFDNDDLENISAHLQDAIVNASARLSGFRRNSGS